MTRASTVASLASALVLATLASTPAHADDPAVHVLPVAGQASGERRPLLIFLHGLGSSGSEAFRDPAIRGLAEHGRMILVAPDGTVDRRGRRFWNAGAGCCNFDHRPVDDLARLETLIDKWRQRPEVDPARVYILGISNGGFMAHRLACWMDDRLAAIVSIAGAGRAHEEACGVVSSLAVLQIHGDADKIVRYEGGRVFDDRELDPHPSAPQTIKDWTERLGCTKPPKTTTADLDPNLPGGETTIESHPNCPKGTAELWTVHGAGHQLITPALMTRVGEFLAAHPKGTTKKSPAKTRR